MKAVSAFRSNIVQFAVCGLLVVIINLLASQQITWADNPDSTAKAHDAKLMKSLQAQVEALEPSKQYSEGVQILAKHVKEFQTPKAAQRVNLSIGRILFHKLNEAEKAIPSLEKAIELNTSSQITVMARKDLSQIYTQKGLNDKAKALFTYDSVTKSKTTPASRGVDTFFMQALDEAKELHSQGKSQQALEILQTLAKKSPPGYLNLVAAQAQWPASIARAKSDHELALQRYQELFRQIPELKHNPRLHSNQIVCAMSTTNTKRTKLLMTQFLKNHPQDSSAVTFLMELGSFAHQEKQIEQAKKYWQEALQHPKVSEDQTRVINENLTLIDP